MSNARAPKLRCGICNGSEFIEAVDHAGQHYIGCARSSPCGSSLAAARAQRSLGAERRTE